MQTFIKLDAVIGKQDSKCITSEELDTFHDKFIKWLEENGYETCAIWELITDDEGKKVNNGR